MFLSSQIFTDISCKCMIKKKIIVIWSLALMPLFSHLKNKFFLAWAPWLGPHLLCRPLCKGKLQAALCKYAADWCLLPACRISAPVISGVACPCSPTVFKLYCSVLDMEIYNSGSPQPIKLSFLCNCGSMSLFLTKANLCAPNRKPDVKF